MKLWPESVAERLEPEVPVKEVIFGKIQCSSGGG